MIRVGMRLPEPFHISGGPIVAFVMMLAYMAVIMVWLLVVAAVYLGLGIAHLVEMGISARHQRQAARQAVER
ncbi:hypothetical protein OHT57_12670 [Streptomyces sp. NBC_00285]|uniref:hypothetical protein n=1 Tax=Streptomyces sp. NBC_00285 TaxID=2975700 RepID=UPI002E2C21F8|nr:hypothetical protein [Streptomyces sp. NBC_00285]